MPYMRLPHVRVDLVDGMAERHPLSWVCRHVRDHPHPKPAHPSILLTLLPGQTTLVVGGYSEGEHCIWRDWLAPPMNCECLLAEVAILMGELCGGAQQKGGTQLRHVLFSGTPVASLLSERGIDVRKLATCVHRATYHEGSMTVLEMLTFAAAVAPGAVFFKRHVDAEHRERLASGAAPAALTSAGPPSNTSAVASPSPVTGSAVFSPSLYSPMGPTPAAPVGADVAAAAAAAAAGSHGELTGASAEHILKGVGWDKSPVGAALEVRRGGSQSLLSSPSVQQLCAASLPVCSTLASSQSPMSSCATCRRRR